jgi:hypothetical protein
MTGLAVDLKKSIAFGADDAVKGPGGVPGVASATALFARLPPHPGRRSP